MTNGFFWGVKFSIFGFFWAAKFWQVSFFFLVAWFKRYFLGIQNNLKIHDNSYISRPRSSGNKLLWLGNSARDFLRVTFWSRDFLSFDFFPPFDHPCHLKSRVPTPRALPPPHQTFTEYHLPAPHWMCMRLPGLFRPSQVPLAWYSLEELLLMPFRLCSLFCFHLF